MIAMYYFSAKPCKYGHIAPRNKKNRVCLECHRLRSQKSYRDNPAKHREAIMRWRKANRQSYNAYSREWTKAHLQYYAFQAAKRRAARLRSTPSWLSPDQLEEIKKIYLLCPKGMHVDHIVPLQGKTVCGLHVPWNLQYLTPLENSQKKNKLI